MARRLFPLTVIALLLPLLLVFGCGEAEKTPVTLQLNWFHEAEFAGYYMAQAEGFYADEGLMVTILEGGPGGPAREKILDGTATFAVTSFAEQRDLVAAGRPVTAVMAAFQISPSVIFSLAESDITEPADLVGRTVGITTDYWENILKQTLESAAVDPAQVTLQRVDPDQLDLLYDGTVDAWLGYAHDEPIQAQTAGHDVTNVYPADFGVSGYEGLVIVREETVDADPETVRRFVEASYQGWRYAVEHPDDAAEVLVEWAPDNGLAFHKLAIRAVAPLVDVPQVPVGWIDPARWQLLMGGAWDPDHPGFTMQFSPAQP